MAAVSGIASTKGIALTRMIDGERWVRSTSAYTSKRRAKEVAERERAKGRLARVVEVKVGYVVYSRLTDAEKRKGRGSRRGNWGQTTTTIRKVKSYQPTGRYKETSVDRLKRTVDFRLLQVSPNVIRWKGGKTETVTARTLKKLEKTHTWATDF